MILCSSWAAFDETTAHMAGLIDTAAVRNTSPAKHPDLCMQESMMKMPFDCLHIG